jgi:hypothetical protein
VVGSGRLKSAVAEPQRCWDPDALSTLPSPSRPVDVLSVSWRRALFDFRFRDDGDIIRRMTPDFFDPTPEKQDVVLIDTATLREAEKLIKSCEQCNPEGAEIAFVVILDRITDSDPSVTDYVLEQPAKCPNCRRDILEKTLVEPA